MIAALGRFLFEADGARAAAVFRVAFAAALLVSRLAVTPDVVLFWSSAGVAPAELVAASSPPLRWSMLLVLDSPAAVLTLHWTLVGALLLVLVGKHTRIATIAVFVLVVSFRHRNPLVANAGDQLASIAAFWLMFLDSARVWSLDARRAPARAWSGSAALRMLQLQMCFMYACSVVRKLGDPSWRDGTAVYWAIADVRRWTVPVPAALDHEWLWRGLCYGTLAFEALFTVLVWLPRTRRATLAAGVAFHGSIGLLMGIPWFSLIAIAMLATFVRCQSGHSAARPSLKQIPAGAPGSSTSHCR